jgi:hypothetical protein
MNNIKYQFASFSRNYYPQSPDGIMLETFPAMDEVLRRLPANNAFAGDGGSRPPPACRVIHGPNDSYFEGIVDKSVASVRRALASAFSIPGHAEAYVHGFVVGPEYLLRAGDSVEFLVRWGLKGVGNPWGRDHLRPEPDDYYPTPPFATRGLLEQESFGTTIWEPACGNGAISKVLKRAGYLVISSDIVDRGYGDIEDFLSSRRKEESIVTNPPYKLAEAFVRKALGASTYKVAMLLRLCFLESQQRYPLFTETPLKAVYVFSRRLTFYRGGKAGGRKSDKEGEAVSRAAIVKGGAVAYAWFVWEQGYRGEPLLRWIPPNRLVS